MDLVVYGNLADDEENALMQLVAACYLEDVTELQASHKGKSREGDVSDHQLALEMFAEEANTLLTSTRDMEIALGLEKALRLDAAVIQELGIAEERASRDREMAVALNEGRPPPPRPPTPLSPQSDAEDDKTPRMSYLRLDNGEYDSDDEDDGATSSAMVPIRKGTVATSSARPAPRHDCVICGDKIKGIQFPAPCGHFYDRFCLFDLFERCTRDEELYPPRCCQQEFDFALVRQHLPVQLVSLFLEKGKEYRTKDRVYCHRPTCSTFLGGKTAHISTLLCWKCTTLTCASCKEATHPGQPCAQSDEGVLALAEENGWKRCPGCNHLVELSVGCFHMTCRCRHQFCYLCTARWKTCTCPQWEENRLISAAQNQLDRRIEAQPAARNGFVAPNYDALLRREVERLRTDHECVHTSWDYRPGGGRCEHCNFFLPNYLLRCRGCSTLACVRCRRNRL